MGAHDREQPRRAHLFREQDAAKSATSPKLTLAPRPSSDVSIPFAAATSCPIRRVALSTLRRTVKPPTRLAQGG
ncbi:MAG: hypothetical protein L0Y57_13245, partial [Beijerinckiaceae bacterium]|nr:hypothetical protein [Beijerinckiaceae bacterium]